MHKQVRKLTLTRETLRDLTREQLTQAQGGIITVTNCPSDCAHTCTATVTGC